MICNELYDGQGLGNQLWNYVVTRIIADNKNTNFSILGRNHFKGGEFMKLDFGTKLYGGFSPEGGPPYKLPYGIKNYYREKRENYIGKTTDISRTDSELHKIELNTKIDGNFQSTKYLNGYRNKIIEWLKVGSEYKNNYFGDNACIIHLRCGDFTSIKDVFLPPVYYKNAIEHIKKIDPNIKFYCVTDQKEVAKSILPEIEIVGSSIIDKTDSKKASHHHGGPIGIDFTLLMNAKYLIIPNSSFSWWASYLNTNKRIVIAPKFWASYNNSNGYWSTSDIITEGFTYLDKENKLSSSEDCWIEKDRFEEINKNIFSEGNTEKRKMSSLYKIISLEFRKVVRKIRKKL